jgi:phage gpG-like protein
MLTITVDDAGFRAYLQQMQDRMGDLTPVMDDIGNAMVQSTRGRFETRTDPNGAPWKPWAPSTRRTYPFAGTPAAAGPDGPGNSRLLDRYGTMLDGLNHQPNNNSVRIGFAQPYATYHEYGSSKMPRRGMLMGDPVAVTLGATDEATVIDILGAWVANLGN